MCIGMQGESQDHFLKVLVLSWNQLHFYWVLSRSETKRTLKFISQPVRPQQQDHCIVYYMLYFSWFGLGLVLGSICSGVGHDLVLVWVVLTTTLTLSNLKQKYFGNIIVTMSFIHTTPLEPVYYQSSRVCLQSDLWLMSALNRNSVTFCYPQLFSFSRLISVCSWSKFPLHGAVK